MQDRLQPMVYYALKRNRFPLETAAMEAALNLIPY
jgi:hypothetical protein